MKGDRSAKDDSGRDILIELPFPMNLSRLRKTAERNRSGDENPFGLPMGLRPLPMEEIENPRDKIPQFFPETASAYVEIGIARMLQTLQQEHVKSVAIMATDPRDKLYLAQQIARYSPDVSLLTAESDSLYIHPDYSTYLNGALVASTYRSTVATSDGAMASQAGSLGGSSPMAVPKAFTMRRLRCSTTNQAIGEATGTRLRSRMTTACLHSESMDFRKSHVRTNAAARPSGSA